MGADKEYDVVTLMAESGEEIEFYEVALVEYEKRSYAIMQPVQLLEGMAEDEALVFRVTRCGEEDADKFEIELDDGVIDAVFSEYYGLAESNGIRPARC